MNPWTDELEELITETNARIGWHMTEARKAKASRNNTGNQHDDAAIARRLNREILPIVRCLRQQRDNIRDQMTDLDREIQIEIDALLDGDNIADAQALLDRTSQ